MAKSHEPVLEFLKASEGVSSLRELHHFSWDTLEDMRVKGVIRVTRINCGYEVRLNPARVS
jgi:hypothetical protein